MSERRSMLYVPGVIVVLCIAASFALTAFGVKQILVLLLNVGCPS